MLHIHQHIILNLKLCLISLDADFDPFGGSNEQIGEVPAPGPGLIMNGDPGFMGGPEEPQVHV